MSAGDPTGIGSDAAHPVAADRFRAAMSRWASGVTIFTAAGADGPVGLTVSSFSSLSLDPPLVLGCIARSTGAHDGLVGADRFAVHLLGGGQQDLSNRFAGAMEQRFAGLSYEEGPGGVPLLPLGVARILCSKESTSPGGDHTILIGRVTAAATADGGPLLYFSRAYRRLGDPL